MTKKYGNNKESTKFSLTTNGTPLQLLLEHSSTVLTSLHQYFLFILFLLRNLFIDNIHDHQHIHRMIEPKVLQHKPTNSKHTNTNIKNRQKQNQRERLFCLIWSSLSTISLFFSKKTLLRILSTPPLMHCNTFISQPSI